MNNLRYRNEWKYILDNNDIISISNNINKVLSLDSHIKEKGHYTIHSLYFDDYRNSCMLDNDSGVNKRYKWRIRYYDNDLSYICLEKKEKLNGLSRKKTCQISIQQYDDIINNKVSEVLWNCKDEILKNFCIDIMTRMFMPKIIISYERTAYIEPISNIRITFDRNISASREIDKFLTNDYVKCPIQTADKHLMEVKFDDILPSYIKQATYINKLQQATFSKYYLSRKYLERD